jgi:hypothetical protein
MPAQPPCATLPATRRRAPGAQGLYSVKWLDFGLSADSAALKATAEKLSRTFGQHVSEAVPE